MKRTGIAIVSLALLVLTSATGYQLGQRKVRSQNEIWRSNQSAFEGRLVEIAQDVRILHEFKLGDARSAEITLLAQIEDNLDGVEALVPYASERDRDLMHRTMSGISNYVAQVRPPVATVHSESRDTLHAVYHKQVEETIRSIMEKTSKTNKTE